MFKKLWVCSALLCTGLSFAQQTKIESLDSVVLIDSKFELKRENSGKVVTKISAKDLEKSAGLTIPDLINTVSGIEINGTRSNDGQNLGYYVRGGRNRQVLILVDGVQLSDPSSISNDFDLRLLPLDQVASIEIVKGASSTLYGSGAATAVINITTKAPKDKKISLQLQSTLGTNQSQNDQDYDIAQFDNSVAVSGKLSKFDYQVNFSNRYSENMSSINSENETVQFEDDPFSKYNVYARLGYKISDQLKFYFYGNYDKFNADYDDSFMYADANNELESRQVRTGSHWVATYKNGSFIFSDSYTESKREIFSDYPSKYDSKVYAFDAYNKYIFNDKFHTVLGVNGVFSNFNSYNIPFGESNFEQTVSEDVADFDIVDPYVNVVYISGTGLNVNAGTRLNIHSEYGSNLVYSLNPSYSFKLGANSLKALTSYSTAYITPSLYQLFDSSYGNTELDPEESSTFEIGLELNTNAFNMNYSLVYFNRNTKNFIDFVTVDPKNYISEYQNIGEEFNASGLEFEFSLDPIENLSLTGNYTYTKAEERFALRIPEHKINLKAGYQISDKSYTSLSYQFNDDRTDNFYNNETFANETVVLESYGILDFYYSQQVSDHLKVFAGVDNIFNTEFQELYRYTTRGRNARLGIALNF